MSKAIKPPKADVAVIDDDEAARISIGQMLRLRHFDVHTFASAESALAWPGLNEIDCVISDIKMPGMDGEQFLNEMVARELHPPIVLITGHGDISMAVRCLKAGAYDFVEKPFDDEVLLASVARAVEKMALHREGERLRRRLAQFSSDEEGRFGMIGKSPSMQEVYAQVEVVARSDAPVLIVGETGSGKELVARAIHAESARRRAPFVAVNAGALPENMLNSELFGHARGAFTGAISQRDGKLATASGGTLLLDEVESISHQAQIQLLRVLDDGLVQPLGSDRTRKVDVRLLATTKVDLADEVEVGRMREDFYHRIVVLSVAVPPLRDHPSDIPLLVSHFVKQAADRNGIDPVPQIPGNTFAELMSHTWPGNVRELKNTLERMVITAHDGIAGPFTLDQSLTAGRLLSLPATSGRLSEELERTEKTVIRSVLRQCSGEITTSARILGISRRALYERMKKYGLQKEDFRNG